MTTFTESIIWISVSEKMPNDGETVMLFEPGGDNPVGEGFREDGEWHWASGGLVDSPVTHWAAHPQGPYA